MQMYGNRRTAAFLGDHSGPTPDTQVTHVMLEKIQLAARQRIGMYTLQSMRVEQLPLMYDDVAYQLSAMVIAEALRANEESVLTVNFDRWERKEIQVIYRVPASWWQHFKQQHFPQWALKRWPVELETRSSMQKRMFGMQFEQDFDVRVVAKYPMCDQAFDDRSPFGRAAVHIMHEGTQTKGECKVVITEKE